MLNERQPPRWGCCLLDQLLPDHWGERGNKSTLGGDERNDSLAEGTEQRRLNLSRRRGIIADINVTVTYITRVSRAHCISQSWIIISGDRSTSAVAEASINVIKVTLLPTELLPDDYGRCHWAVDRPGHYQTTLCAVNYRFAANYRANRLLIFYTFPMNLLIPLPLPVLCVFYESLLPQRFDFKPLPIQLSVHFGW